MRLSSATVKAVHPLSLKKPQGDVTLMDGYLKVDVVDIVGRVDGVCQTLSKVRRWLSPSTHYEFCPDRTGVAFLVHTEGRCAEGAIWDACAVLCKVEPNGHGLLFEPTDFKGTEGEGIDIASTVGGTAGQ